MNERDFVAACKLVVVDWFNKHSDNVHIIEGDVYVVWMCKTLQNNKALLSTNVPDGRYYELTYNGDNHELYLDVYKKQENECIKVVRR